MKLLLIEDNPDITDFIKLGFEAEGFTVETSMDGQEGSYLARTNAYDMIILDYSLPNKNGLMITSELRSYGLGVPIIFLSVVGETRIKIKALEKGADDYMTKPFSFDELKARVEALMRRPRKVESSIVKVGELVLDKHKQVAFRNDLPIYLTRKEYNLLEYFMKNPGAVLSRSMIMEHVWSSESDPFSNTVEAHVANLRKKVNIGDQRDIIRNIPGRGYLIEP